LQGFSAGRSKEKEQLTLFVSFSSLMIWRLFFLALKHRFARSQEAVYATTLQNSTLAKKKLFK
jgi:hypothetical protein